LAGYLYLQGILMANTSYSTLILADVPQAYWRLNELSGTTANDSSGNNYNGTYSNCTLAQTAAVRGDLLANCVYFNGTTSLVDCPSQSVSNFSLELWAYALSSNQCAVGQGNSGFTAFTYFLRVGTGGNGGSGFHSSAGYQQVTCPTITTSTWQHHVMTYDGTNLRFYLNGSLTDGPTAATGPPDSIANHTILGQVGDSSIEPYSGYLSEVAVYNFALSAVQISRHYRCGIETNKQGVMMA
jgi:hypothetical protein